MKAIVSSQILAASWRALGRLFFLLLTANCLLSCSIPNLEPTECTEARNVVREFYSYHFGNDMQFSRENLELRKRFLTTAFFDKLQGSDQAVDPFTKTNDFPKAFRIGECKVMEAGRSTSFQVLLFWKDSARSEQRSIHAAAVKENDKWLIDAVNP
jgi:hypothetical protein